VRPRHQDGVNPTLGDGANGTHGDVGKNSTVANDLTTRLSQMLNSYAPYGSSTHQLIQRASAVVAFEIVVASSFPSFSNTSATSTIDAGRSANTASPEPLAFPATLHMDQFLDGDLDPANKTRVVEGVARRKMGVLASRRGMLVGFEVCFFWFFWGSLEALGLRRLRGAGGSFPFSSSIVPSAFVFDCAS
jgi:hypothetical protein